MEDAARLTTERDLPVGDLAAGPDGMIAFMTDGGVSNAAGEWTVTITELVGNSGERLTGPWVLEFSSP